jgi:hypothetical protein
MRNSTTPIPSHLLAPMARQPRRSDLRKVQIFTRPHVAGTAVRFPGSDLDDPDESQ